MHACRCASNESLGHFSPGSLVFGRDMLLNIPIIADIITLQEARQAKIDQRSSKQIASVSRHEFKVDDKSISCANANSKADPIWDGPFPIIQVHTNNTVTVRRDGIILERITIRRIKPSKS